jgi:lysophospholipase L1-like esterase
VIGGTITPCEGADIPGYCSDQKEAVRETVNRWIRTSNAFDGIIDFDAVVRDPDHPTRLQAKFASKDHLHPNDAGYKAMADSIDLNLFKSDCDALFFARDRHASLVYFAL